MSAGGEDTKNLDKGEETPAATVSEGIPMNTTTDVSSCGLKNVEQTPVTSTLADLEDPREIEAIIEKKLPSNKEKALDVDSELDFELKWDDDTENLGDDIDLGIADKELESGLLTEKYLDSTEKETDSLMTKDTDSLDKEFDSAFTEKDLDSLHKTDSNVTSIEKDLDSLDKEIDSAFTSTEKALGNIHQEYETDLLSIGKDVDSLDKDSDSIFTDKEKNLDSVDKKTDSDFTAPENLDKQIENAVLDIVSKDLDIVSKNIQHAITSLEQDALDEIDGNVANTGLKMDSDNAMDDDRINQTKSASEPEISPQDPNDGPKTEGTLEDNINKDISAEKESPAEFETTSLDEELVYSDAEAPDIEDKELMDEIDAEITAEIIKDKLGSEAETSQASSDLLTLQKESEEGKATEIKSQPMDVDNDLTESVNLLSKSDPNNTSSSTTDLDTSIYDINKVHGLDRPDVMIDIPTQELIESFDDTENDLIENLNEKQDQSTNVMIRPDLVETTTKEKTHNLIELQKIEDEINLQKHVSGEISETDGALEKMLTDEVENAVEINKSAGDAIQIESMDVDTHVSKEIEKPDVIDNIEFNVNVETNKLDQENVRSLEEKVSLADIILEATTQLEALNTTPEEVELSNEVKDVASSDLKHKEVEDTTPTCVPDTKLATLNKDIETTDNSNLREDTTLSSHIDKAPQSTSSIEDKEVESSTPEQLELAKEIKDVESSDLKHKEVEDTTSTCIDNTESSTFNKDIESTDNSDLKGDITLSSHIEKALEPTSSIADNVESLDDLKLKNLENLTTKADKAQPSTSKELNIDSSEKLNLKNDEYSIESHVDEAQPSTSNIKLNDESDNVNLKNVDTHEQQSTNHSELSDEDQEATATDSLGLLAESSRVMDDDDEQEQEAEPDDDDDEDDFDQDDESNQMTAEHSEDSNAQQSEADVPREAMDVDESNDAEPHDMADAHDMDDAADDNDDEKSTDEKEDSNDEKEESNDEKVESNDEKDESNDDKDDSNDERDDLQIQIADVVSQTVIEAIAMPDESVEAAAETEKAIEADLEDKKEETVKVPPVASTVEDKETVKPTDNDSESASKLRQLLLKESASSAETLEAEKKSPSKTKKLEISKPKNEINFVDLGESSSEDDVQVVKKPEVAAEGAADTDQEASEAKPAQKPVKLSTKEVLVKPAPAASPVKPETTPSKTSNLKASIDFGLEIFSLDSDDEETEVRSTRKSKLTALELDNARQTNKCINMRCTSDGSVPLVPASLSAAVYYAANQQRGGGLCLYCAKRFEERSEELIKGVKDLTPFLSMDMCMIREEFVEISDSDSEDEPEVSKGDEVIGEKGAKFLEEHLADMFNGAWKKYDMEERLLAAQAEINVEVGQLEEECKQIDAMLNECQRETDKLRNDLYTAFADERRELPAITICDTPINQWSGLEEAVPLPVPETREQPPRSQKRRAPAAPAPEPNAKRAAVAPPEEPKPAEPKPGPSADAAAQNDDDNADISVVKLSVESAPAGLPPPGVPTRPPLRPNMLVYAMRNMFGAWHQVRIIEVQPKITGQFTTCRVRFEQPKTMTKLLPARCLAYEHPPDVRLTIGTRVVALFKDHRVTVEKKAEGEKKEAYYSGIVAEIPNPVNNFRYLIFFDDGYAQYVQHSVTRLVCECAPRVWDEVHPFSRQFVRDYLRAYPERPMVRLHAGQSIKTEWDGKWWVSKVLQVDASLVLVYFEGKKDNKTEWIYRGSTRLAPLYLELQAAERTRARPLPRAQAARRYNMPYVEYTRSDEPTEKATPAPAPGQTPQQTQAQFEQEIRRQRAVAKKSTAPAAPPAPPPATRDAVTSRVVFYTPKNAIKPYKMVPHTCGPKCKRTDVLALKDLRTYNPLTKPLLSGWERQQVRYRIPAVKSIIYRAPCGRRIRDYAELHRYLQATESDMGVDLFDFNPSTHCLAEFLLNKCLISKKDLSHGKENVPVPCVNYYDSSLPEFCSYNTERTPTAGVPLNLDPEFLCGCDCTDDCADKTKCACWKMTLEGARTIGLDTDEVGYVYKRLPEPLPSGIYECNSRCKCKQTCLNRVAQHPLQLKLQVFKTANRGWGIRALNDVPKGAFLCVYAGNLLTDATANLDGLNEGDEYLAELDYIEVVEQMKEGFEEDIPDDAKKLDEEESDSSGASSSDEERKQDGDDDDFRPVMPYDQYTRSEYSKRLRKREKSKKAKEKEEREKKEREEKEKDGEDCITISDDEELREPAHFAAQTGMKGKEFVSKYKSVRTLFGKDEACYIMDAKVQGNIGRYLNHSCTPNVFVQNVFVDTHDPRFPWVAFFALSQIRAGTELTWNYNYDVGSVPGKVLYCYCNAPNCRGRLL